MPGVIEHPAPQRRGPHQAPPPVGGVAIADHEPRGLEVVHGAADAGGGDLLDRRQLPDAVGARKHHDRERGKMWGGETGHLVGGTDLAQEVDGGAVEPIGEPPEAGRIGAGGFPVHVQYLVSLTKYHKEGAPMDGTEELFAAIAEGAIERVEALLRADPGLAGRPNGDGLSPVLLALYHRRPDLADLVVNTGVELTLHEVTALGRVDEVAARLDGAVIRAHSADGFALLHYAAFFGHAEVVTLLLGRGADPSAVARNAMRVQPLHSAAAGRHVDCMRLLLEAGAPVDGAQHGGYTALHAAALHGDTDMVGLLLAHGADPDRADAEGRTPRDLATAEGHAAILSLFDSGEAKGSG